MIDANLLIGRELPVAKPGELIGLTRIDRETATGYLEATIIKSSREDRIGMRIFIDPRHLYFQIDHKIIQDRTAKLPCLNLSQKTKMYGKLH